MDNNRVFHLIQGQSVVSAGEIGDEPCILITHAAQPGTPGADAAREGLPADSMAPDEVALVFDSVDRATVAFDMLSGKEHTSFQSRVKPWMTACFGEAVSSDRLERGDRLLEEVLELLQSGDYPRERIYALVEYVFSRPKGEPAQEVGGVMVTLAAHCLAHDVDMHAAGETELARVWTKVDKIRAKWESKPVGSALPVPTGWVKSMMAVMAERRRQIEVEGWTPEHDDQHRRGELAGAAAAYALANAPGYLTLGFWTDAVSRLWPFEAKWYKPFGSEKNNLEKSAALLLAEWERLDRIETSEVCQCPRP